MQLNTYIYLHFSDKYVIFWIEKGGKKWQQQRNRILRLGLIQYSKN